MATVSNMKLFFVDLYRYCYVLDLAAHKLLTEFSYEPATGRITKLKVSTYSFKFIGLVKHSAKFHLTGRVCNQLTLHINMQLSMINKIVVNTGHSIMIYFRPKYIQIPNLII